MLDFFTKILGQDSAAENDGGQRESVEIATAVFLLDMAHADSDIHPLEEAAVRDGLRTIFEKTAGQIDSLLEKARQAREKSFDLYQFAKEINAVFQAEDKILVLENIWRVVYADEVVDKYEEALIRKIAKLLRLSHREMIQAKLKVLGEGTKNQTGEPNDELEV
jgi:uncharacterized tellurite resistance protein B-like protein